MSSSTTLGNRPWRDWSKLSIKFRSIYLFLLAYTAFSGLFLFNQVILSSWYTEFQYFTVIGIILFLPLFAGLISFWWIFRWLKLTPEAEWITYPIYWVAGLLALNIPYFINTFAKVPPLLMVWMYLGVCSIFYLFFNSHDLWKVHELVIKQKINWKFTSVFLLCILLVMLRQVFWGGIKGFSSVSLDSYQNIHLAKILNDQRYALFPSSLATLFQFDSYTSFLGPLIAINIHFYNWIETIKMLYLFEIIADPIIFWIRKKFFETVFYLNEITSSVLSLFSIFISYFIINNTPLLQNQNVVVLLFTSGFYFLVKRKWKLLFLVILIGFPFHFFISAIALFYYSIYALSNLPPVAKLYFDKRWIINIFFLVLFGVLIYMSITTLLQSYFIELAKIFFNKPSTITFAEGFKLIIVFRNLINAFGPATVASLILASLIGIFTVFSKNIWMYIISFIHIIFFMLPFEFFGRLMGLAAIPFVLAIYFFIKSFVKKEWATNTYLVLILVVNCFWWVNVVAQTPNTLYTSTFFTSGYYDFLPKVIDSDDFRKQIVHQPNQVKVVSDYLTKHISEISIHRTNDLGFYEDRVNERQKNSKALRAEEDPCKLFEEKFVLFVVAEKTIRFLDFPDRIIDDSLLNIYDARSPDYFLQEKIKQYTIHKTDGQIIINRTNNYDMRIILIQCP